jgi:hypothetical protein
MPSLTGEATDGLPRLHSATAERLARAGRVVDRESAGLARFLEYQACKAATTACDGPAHRAAAIVGAPRPGRHARNERPRNRPSSAR